MLGSFLLRVKITQSHVHHIHVEFLSFVDLKFALPECLIVQPTFLEYNHSVQLQHA